MEKNIQKDLDDGIQIVVDHQLISKNLREGTKFYITTPKTKAGNRTIPMTRMVRHAFERQKEYQFMLGIDRNVTVDGYNGFIFTSKSGRPLQPSAVNNALYNMVDAFN